MGRNSKEDLDRFFDYGVFAPKRLLYIGSSSSSEPTQEESGTDHQMAEKTIKGLQYLDLTSDRPIIIIMNNPGGTEEHGMAIYDTITSCRSHVTMIGVGYCASMGSIILQSADTRILTRNCMFMIHDGHQLIEGTPKSVEEWAESSKKSRQKMYEIYHNKIKTKNPNITIKQIEKMCAHDKIFSAQEAVNIGFADKILDGNIHQLIGE